MNQDEGEAGFGRTSKAAVAALLAATLLGCDSSERPDGAPEADAGAGPDPVFAQAEIRPVDESGVTGLVRFDQRDGVLQISGELSGLSPGAHGLHIHDASRCSADVGASDHFSPENHPHGSPDQSDRQHHAGDLGNVTADDRGNVDFELADTELRIGAGANDIIGLAVVIHENADDLATQPDGNAGAAIGCGLVDPLPQPDFVPESP